MWLQFGNTYHLAKHFINRIVDFEDYNYIEAYGENLYRAVDGATFKDSTASVNQGYLETSNINVVSEMVDMINIAREFESNQKIVNSTGDSDIIMI